MVIDAHIHLWDKVKGSIGEPVRALRHGVVKIGHQALLGMPPFLLDGRCRCEVALSVMDAAGVDAAVVTQEYLDGNQNAYLAAVQRECTERFFVHGRLEFRRPDRLAAEFRRVTEKYGFRGIKLPASYLAQATPRIWLTDARLMAVFDQMERRRMILSVDLDYGESQVKEMRAVARAFPQLRIALGHFAMAGRKGWLKQLALAEEPNVYVESGGIAWLFRHEGPRFPGAQKAVHEAVRRVGVEKLMWGSDFLSDSDRADILGGTAARLFGFKKPRKPGQPLKRITELD